MLITNETHDREFLSKAFKMDKTASYQPDLFILVDYFRYVSYLYGNQIKWESAAESDVCKIACCQCRSKSQQHVCKCL